MELITRGGTAALIEAFANGTTSLDRVRAWVGRVVAANETDIADADAPVVAQVINVFEDDSLDELQLRKFARDAVPILQSDLAADRVSVLLNLLSRRDHMEHVFSQAANGTISSVALENALAKTGLPLPARRKLTSQELVGYRKVATALHSGDLRDLIELA